MDSGERVKIKMWGQEQKSGFWHRCVSNSGYDFAMCRERRHKFIATTNQLPPVTSDKICPVCKIIAVREIVEGL